MIRFALKCENDHRFESWFQSDEAFGKLAASGMVECPTCGSAHVEKTLMAPSVAPKGNKKEAAPQQMAAGPDPEIVEAIRKLREHVETNSDYVGDRFADEARAMHLGDAPARSIYGEVRPDEARRLAEDGVPALPLPFVPRAKTN